jgi:type II secretory pathway component PulF
MRARRIFYEGLASMLDAGIPVRSALDQLAGKAGGSFAEAARHLRGAADAGRPLAEGMAERPAAFPRFHAELVRAAEASGTVDRAFRSLAAGEAEAERTAGRAFARVIYPLAVIHLAAVPLNIGLLSQGRPGKFALAVLGWWVPLWIVLGLGWWLWRRATSSGPLGAVLLAIPFLGGMLRDRALLRWARVFAALDDAGLDPATTAERAAAATGWAVLEGPLALPAAALRSGRSRMEAFAPAPLPAPFRAALFRGEETGTLAESLGKEADALENSLESRGDSLIALLPVIFTVLAGVVVLYVAMSVLGAAQSIR